MLVNPFRPIRAPGCTSLFDGFVYWGFIHSHSAFNAGIWYFEGMPEFDDMLMEHFRWQRRNIEDGKDYKLDDDEMLKLDSVDKDLARLKEKTLKHIMEGYLEADDNKKGGRVYVGTGMKMLFTLNEDNCTLVEAMSEGRGCGKGKFNIHKKVTEDGGDRRLSFSVPYFVRKGQAYTLLGFNKKPET